MQQITQGQRMPLSNLIQGHALSVSVQLQIGSPNSVDVSCFGLDSRGHLSDDRYMTFYNQPTSPCSSVRQTAPGEFALQLSTLPSSIDRLVFTAAIADGRAHAPRGIVLTEAKSKRDRFLAAPQNGRRRKAFSPFKGLRSAERKRKRNHLPTGEVRSSEHDNDF